MRRRRVPTAVPPDADFREAVLVSSITFGCDCVFRIEGVDCGLYNRQHRPKRGVTTIDGGRGIVQVQRPMVLAFGSG